MMHSAKDVAIKEREDISRFIVHLTRDDSDTFNNGSNARENFLKILKGKKITPYRPHCLFNYKLRSLEKTERKKLNVACFTEVPLNQLHLLTRQIIGRDIKLEPYGFVFTKQFIVSAGGQPALYINSYNDNSWLKDALMDIFNQSHEEGKFTSRFFRILPYVNAMHEKYDFSWEREWRVRKNLEFKLTDLVCLILPDDGEEDIKDACANVGLAVVSPGWTYEQIVAELASQQKITKRLVLDRAVTSSTKKNEKDEDLNYEDL